MISFEVRACTASPPTAEQSRSAACHVLNGKGRLQGQRFCLCHFSYLANLALVTQVERDALTLGTGEFTHVSRRYYQGFVAHCAESLK